MTVRDDLLRRVELVEEALAAGDRPRAERRLRNLRGAILVMQQPPEPKTAFRCPVCELERPTATSLANHLEVVHDLKEGE
jgi:hypothetical protein